MKRASIFARVAESMAGLIVCAGLVIAGLSLVVLGFTFLPVIGFFLGISALALSGCFLNHLWRAQILEEKKSVLLADAAKGAVCTLP